MRSGATIVVVLIILSVSVSYPFKLKGGDSAREGSRDPSHQGNQAKSTPGWDAQSIGRHTDSLFES